MILRFPRLLFQAWYSEVHLISLRGTDNNTSIVIWAMYRIERIVGTNSIPNICSVAGAVAVVVVALGVGGCWIRTKNVRKISYYLFDISYASFFSYSHRIRPPNKTPHETQHSKDATLMTTRAEDDSLGVIWVPACLFDHHLIMYDRVSNWDQWFPIWKAHALW